MPNPNELRKERIALVKTALRSPISGTSAAALEWAVDAAIQKIAVGFSELDRAKQRLGKVVREEGVQKTSEELTTMHELVKSALSRPIETVAGAHRAPH